LILSRYDGGMDENPNQAAGSDEGAIATGKTPVATTTLRCALAGAVIFGGFVGLLAIGAGGSGCIVAFIGAVVGGVIGAVLGAIGQVIANLL
jgi:hypothetical protein